MSGLQCLLYMSHATRAMTREEIDRLLNGARERNRLRGVTGDTTAFSHANEISAAAIDRAAATLQPLDRLGVVPVVGAPRDPRGNRGPVGVDVAVTGDAGGLQRGGDRGADETYVAQRGTDQGPGIPAAKLEEIWAGTYKSQRGMGKGLVAVKKLVDEFQLDTAAGKGTTVTCLFRGER